ncbi:MULTISPECIES: response regulator [unclassified Fibrobacter]|uniref:hybrid sensor histidine kinase/response regulator n=1 Tax=unclassified Fibrobacter TaxID=2634177 RepID=UPI000911ADCD|nr:MULTISPECIES: response regulator [Fibrobacter]MCL4101962.1 Sensor histidine kinase RcsC [Fibrobacter succinogenes]MDO4946472.1 response regulator [Fibrobacter sp.]OWV07174.1 hypothetical protein B7993_02870 [Fibrobacter sp. UWH3]SHK77426.1 Signal transduction histidine kinase [Fibrobacter sp. UWH6]
MTQPSNKNSRSDKIHVYLPLVFICVVLESIFIISTYFSVEKQIKTEAKAHAEEIVASIQSELNKSFETTKLLIDLHKVYGDVFLKDFNEICLELTRDNLAIGSMYFAPKGIIKYAFPDEVDSATANFNMLEDPVQGLKSQKALEDRKATIAGPHNLIEGGEGFILRNPAFINEEFIGFSIVVLDKGLLLNQISNNLHFSNYNFAVWKEPDSTAVLDKNGFILTNFNNGKIGKDVQLSFDILNDTWHITLEPIGGWNTLKAMRGSLLTSFLILATLLFLLYMHSLAAVRKRELQMQIFANKAKSSFLFSMSHDIRTPMNAIIGFANLMQKNLGNPEKIADYLNKLQASSKFLLSLINNVLEMARIESGKMTLEEDIIYVKNFQNVTDAVFTDLAHEKGLDFRNDSNLINDYVIGDEMKIRELVLNIVSNAIKYTPSGGFVHLSLTESKCDRPGYTMYTAIAEDSGIGINKDYLPHIFEEFSREKNSTESKISGSGLGMPIVKRLIDLMNGTIDIQSKVGKGTKITIVLYLRLPTAEQIYAAKQVNENANGKVHEESTSESKSFQGKRILLVEDNDLNAEIAEALLEELGFTIERAADGQSCIKMIEAQDYNYYDIVLMDIQMPIMDGYEATRHIRQFKNKNKRKIPIVAMTANAFDEDRQKALNIGMNGHVAKPINTADLVKALTNALSDRQ